MNVLNLPFLPLRDGRTVSPREALLFAETLPPLRAPWAHLDAGAYRFLLALLLRAVGPHGALPKAWPREALARYLEAWEDRFLLPRFLRVEGMGGMPEKPWHALSFLHPWQSTKLYQVHVPWDTPPPVDWPGLLLTLFAFLAFVPSAGRSRLGHTGSGPLVGRLALWAEGESLADTLRLLAHRFGPYPEEDHRKDPPAWEEDLTVEGLNERPFRGPMDRLLPRSRALDLSPGPTWVRMEAGHRYRGGGEDPMALPFRYREDRPPYGPWLAIEAQSHLPPGEGVVRVRVAGVLVDQAAVKGLVDSEAPLLDPRPFLEEVARVEKAVRGDREAPLRLLEARMRLAEALGT